MPAFLRRGLAALMLLVAPGLAAAGAFNSNDCEIIGPTPNMVDARFNQVVSFTFVLQRTSSNPGNGCTGINGSVNNEAQGTYTVMSSGGDATPDPHDWIANENETITVMYNTGDSETGGGGTLYINCDHFACSTSEFNSFTYGISVVDRRLETFGETSITQDPNRSLGLQVRATDDGFFPSSPVQIDWTVSGPGTLDTPSSASDFYGDAYNIVNLGDSAPGNNVVTVTATRADEPNATITFTITLNTYELSVSSPPPGTAVTAGQVVPLTVEYRVNGNPVSGAPINWTFDANPNGSMLRDTFNFTNPSGIGDNDLTVGSPNPGSPPPPIVVRATISGGAALAKGGARPKGFPPLASAVFTLQPMDVLAVNASSGNNQSATVGDPLPAPLTVGVSRNGLPDSGAIINWTVAPAGAATLSAGQSTADTSGQASITVTRVDAAGPFTVTAAHNDDPSKTAVFNATGVAPVLTLGSATGDGQSGFVNQPMAQPLGITARANGLGQSGVTINYTVTPTGFATVSPTSVVTDVNGFAQVTVTNGPTGGNYTVTATRADDPTVSYTYGLVALQRDLVKPTDSGNAQFGATNTALPNPLVVVATLNGSPEAGVPITWQVISGDAQLSGATSPTDNAGRSSVNVTLGATPGNIVVRATRTDDGSTEDYTLQAFSKMLVKPSTGSGDGQSGGVNTVLPQPLVALATLNGSPEAGVPVTWAVVSGPAAVTATTSPTDNAGRSTATITLGATAGTAVIRATRPDTGAFQDYTVTALDVRTLDKPTTGSGDNQSGPVDTELAQSLVVFARNNGQPAAGVTVNWTASNGATPIPASSVTDANGRASIQLRLGPNPGTVTVTATRADASTATASFVLTATAGQTQTPVLTIEKPNGSGDGTTLAPGDSVTLVARTLSDSQPDANVTVFWQVVAGSGAVGNEQSISDTQGLVRTTFTAGMTPGPVTVRATHGNGGGSVTYTLTVSGTATGPSLEIVSGDDQAAAPGSRGADLVVRLTQNGVPIPNATVAWQVLQGDATLDSPSSSTDGAGLADNGITFGASTGEILVQASANGTSTTFHLRTETAAAAVLRLVAGNNQRGPVGTRADQPIVVEVVDGSGAPIAGRTVGWEVVSGSATLDAPSSSTDANGRSSMGFRFGNTAGPVRIRANIGTVVTQIVTVDAVAFQPTLVIVAGDNQTAPAGTLLPQDLVVQIAAPPGAKTLAGVTVRWTVVDGGGTLAAATSLTDANGRASNKYTLGPASGAQHVRAAIDGGASVTFTENAAATAGPLTIVSGNNQVLPTRSPSAPLVVSLASTTGTPISGAVLTWSASNAELTNVRTTTNAQGQASNIAEVLLPGTASITVSIEGVPNSSTVVFTLTGGVANTPQLGQPEETVANAVDNLCPALVALSNPTPAQADLRARCLELVNNAGDNPGQVDAALDELRQDVALAQANAAFVSSRAQFDNLKTRIAALRSGSAGGADFSGLAVMNSSGVMPLSFLPSAVVQDGDEGEGGGSAEGQELDAGFSKWGFFASGLIGRGSYDGSSVTPEYDYDSNGLTAGVDYRVNDQFIVGASLGWNTQDTELAHDGGAVETDGWSVSGYTTWYHQNQWYFDGVLTFGSNDYDLARAIRYTLPGTGGTTTVDQVARADTSGDQLSLAFSFGRDFQRGNLSFGPYFRGMYTKVDFDGYEEVLGPGPGSGLGLAIDERELKSMTAVVGGKATWALSKDWGILMPHVSVEWEHEFEDDAQQLAARFLHDPTHTPILVEGDEIDTDFFNVGFGLSALFANGRSAFIYYEHLAGSEGLSQDNLSIGVRLEF